MPRNISASLEAKLTSSAVLALSKMIRIDRTDGVAMGFTDADAPITFGGLEYEAIDGIDSTSIQSTAGTGVDNLDVSGALSSSRITEDDLARGVYDGARITIMLVERELLALSRDPQSGLAEADAAVVSSVGYFGEVTIADGQYKAIVRSLGSKLRQSIGDTTCRLCRCMRVGNGQCRLDMGGQSNGGYPNRVTRTVAAVAADGAITFAGDNAPTDHYSWGLVRFTTGANKAVERDVKLHTNAAGQAVLNLREAFPFPVAVGDAAILEVGCDRRIETCRTKFSNANNFHGEPFLPGNDAVTQVGRQ